MKPQNSRRKLLRFALLLATTMHSAAFAQTLKRSDVVFMGNGRPEIYQAYGATVVDWGGHAWGDDTKANENFQQRVKAAQALGIQYNAGIGMLTEFAGMIQSEPAYERAVCRAIDGKPIMVPWLWDQKVNGETGKNYWFCSNSPFYQAYLRRLVNRAMIGQPDGFHIDDFGGTTGAMWQGGCFCESCMAQFRAYLEKNVAPEKLRALGIEKLDGFDYGKFLMPKHVADAEDYKKKRYALPLDAEFRVFQAQSAGAVVRQLQEYAVQVRGKALARSVNGAPPGLQALVVRPHVDHYSCEIAMGPLGSEWEGVDKKKLTVSSAITYKCGDMTGHGIAGTADGHSWAYVAEKNAVNLCRYWIAESYAFGHNFMAPSEHQWCYTKEKGTHWLKSEAKDYADLYQFVRRNAALFDDYEAVSQVGVLFSHAQWRKSQKETQSIIAALVEANVPCALLPAGDELLDLRLSAASAARFEKIVTPAPVALDAEQQKVLGQVEPGRKIVWKDASTSLGALQPWLSVENEPNVWALPRRKTGAAQAPLVIHLLNRNYDFATDKTQPRRGVVLNLRRALLGGKTPRQCTMLAPGAEHVAIPLEKTPDGVRLTVPELAQWAVLRVE